MKISHNFPSFAKSGGIVIGQGMVQYLEEIGFADVGAREVLFHEFAHHIQFSLGLDPRDGTPERTRYSELMVDALAAYYGHHPRGATLQRKRIQELVETAFFFGDCFFDDPGHHGTVRQV